jgi:hypothetical protein
MKLPANIFIIILSLIGAVSANAQTVNQTEPANPVASQDTQIVDYPASFFERYQPRTALDIVNQIPGFVLNNGDSERGFGGAVGNVLINDRRPSAKQDLPSQILSRIPSNQIERVELIRGQVRNIDLQGHTIVANVILSADAPATARWETSMRYNFSVFPPTFDAGVSLSDRWGDIEYNTGIRGRSGSSGDAGTDREYNSARTLKESTFDKFNNRAYNGAGTLNASTWVGENFVRLNTELFVEARDTILSSHITPHLPTSQYGREATEGDTLLTRFELGTDIERLLQPDLLGKAILLFSWKEYDVLDDELIFDGGDNIILQTIADTETVTTELIGRLEFDWARWTNHTVQANFELAYNVLDNSLLQTEDTGAGPFEVIVPGANTIVKETRGDFMFQDTWSLGSFELDLGLGGEVSQISQSGDAEEKRDFFFLKPMTMLTYSPNRQSQTRLRLLREVAQLNFSEFVSTAVFEDDDLALGNPNLSPERTWISEISHERRFGEIGVITLTAFHHWISDVQDLLPITDEFEVPGNIGDGRRWGLELESAVPLTWLGLTGSRLDVQLRWQDSSVTDPVTGDTRVLSSTTGFPKPLPFREELEFISIVKYRQDFREARISWGAETRQRTERPRFKVNELEVIDEGTEVNAFIETTRFLGLKIRLEGQDILDMNQSRDRTIYQGLRNLSSVQRTILRDRNDGARFFVSVSGNF